jgi:hypothetical protein
MATKKGQQSIMANQALIQASRGTGEQFIDYGAVMQPAITGILKEMEIADNKMDRFINALPPGANIEKLPEGMRPEVERYLRDAKEEYAAAADVASKLSPRDPGYREAIDKMNSIKTGFINLNKNLESHLSNRVEFIQDKYDLSNSLNYNDNKFLTSVYAGDYDGFKVTGGELEFFDKAKGKHVRTPEFPQYSLRDVIGANRVGKMFNVYTKAGENGKMWSQERANKDVGTIFREVGVQGVIDMAFDGFDEENSNYVDTVVKQLVAPNMSDQDWLVSDQREDLKTKEGFAPYRQGFQKFVTEIVKDGWDEGNKAYEDQIDTTKPGSTQAGFEAIDNAINNLVAKDKLTLNDLLSITLPSDRKFEKRNNNFIVVDTSGYDIPGTEFDPNNKQQMRNVLQYVTNLPVQYRTTGDITKTDPLIITQQDIINYKGQELDLNKIGGYLYK